MNDAMGVIALKQILMILALAFFILAAVGVSTPRINLMATGLAFWVLAELVR